MIDTHCHLTYDGLSERIDQVLSNARTVGVTGMITVGTTPDDAWEARRLAQIHPDVFATVGLHPHYALQWPDRESLAAEIIELAQTPEIVALGEMGLDRHYDDPPMDDQRRVFQWQLETAQDLADRLKLPMPIVIHNREATDETLAMLRDSLLPPLRFVFHCFTGTDAELDAILDFGAMVSFTGIATFGSAKHLAAAVARVPDDRIMVETDSPYLTPEPHRKVRPNEPMYVVDVARFVAKQRGVSAEQFIALSDANAQRFFGLPTP